MSVACGCRGCILTLGRSAAGLAKVHRTAEIGARRLQRRARPRLIH